jgi:hypothetical protein
MNPASPPTCCAATLAACAGRALGITRRAAIGRHTR